MSDAPPFPLLSVPAGVENIILSFVASGDGGLNRMLKLREVCKTTRSWVDRLPQEQGELIFSKAKVTMNPTTGSLKRFLDSAPPFAVTTLYLDSSSDQDETPEFEELWDRYYSFWAPRLKNLIANYGGRDFMAIGNCPAIRSLCLTYPIITDNSRSFPSALERASEVSFGFPFRVQSESTCRMLMEKLEKNSNLKILEVGLATAEEFESLRKFIDDRKTNTELNFTLCIHEAIPLDFAQSVVNSKSKFRLKIFCDLENLGIGFPQSVMRGLCEMMEYVEYWKPTEHTLLLLDNLPRLTSLRMVDSRDDDNLDVNWDQIALPPLLEVLGFTYTREIPAISRFPESLTSLTLLNFQCNIVSLLNSLAILNSRCPDLATLSIKWRMNNTQMPVRDFETSMGFLKLRSLTFLGELYKKANTGIGRDAVLNGFNWDKMELKCLTLAFTGYRNGLLPVVNEELLTKICEGPTAKTLLRIDVANESVTPEGLPLLERLRSCATSNTDRLTGD